MRFGIRLITILESESRELNDLVLFTLSMILGIPSKRSGIDGV